ncbi:hypothetical protein [Pseudomonas phage vB_PaeP_4029]|nr:hypothetical protein [Pseudomonas phage vB_PaeP_4029]UYE96502.1 hypothetical protein [Pseudomonas phage vB_PaeP_4032]UYE96588.1 hypothetical protein [Pseudomonas phage vB_PaeP_4034]
MTRAAGAEAHYSPTSTRARNQIQWNRRPY